MALLLSASPSSLSIADGAVQAQVECADIQRIIYLQKIVPLPTTEPDTAWVV
jgi:hypothetical protein